LPPKFGLLPLLIEDLKARKRSIKKAGIFLIRRIPPITTIASLRMLELLKLPKSILSSSNPLSKLNIFNNKSGKNRRRTNNVAIIKITTTNEIRSLVTGLCRKKVTVEGTTLNIRFTNRYNPKILIISRKKSRLVIG
jgi:hypothetical protein